MTNITPTTYNQKPEGRSASIRSRNTIACNICQAVYAPAQEYEYLLHAPHTALESAFMSMCHFCFRCRQPSCPSCWDHVHGVCGRCTLEANLPFRSQVSPLRGMFFPPMRQILPKHKRASQTRLICIRPGCFQNTTSTDSAKTASLKATAIKNIPHPTSIADATQKSSQHMKIGNTKQATKTTCTSFTSPPRPQTAATQTPPPPPTVSIDEMDTQPGLRIHTTIKEIDTRPEPRNHTPIDEIDTHPGPRNHTTLDEIDTRPEPRNHTPIDEIDTRPEPRKHATTNEVNTHPRPRGSIARRVERVITSLLFVLLLFIVLLIILAEASQYANSIIVSKAHIDIQAEIAYILQLIRQVFS